MKIGQRIQTARKRRGWNRERLATEAGVGIVSVSKLERDQGNPTLATLLAVASALDLSLAELLTSDKRAA